MKYQFINTKNEKFKITLKYVKGVFRGLEWVCEKPLSVFSVEKFKQLLACISEVDFEQSKLNLEGLNFVLQPPLTPPLEGGELKSDNKGEEKRQKIVLWKRIWKEKKGFNCMLNARQIGMLVGTKDPVSLYEPLVLKYHQCTDWWANPKTVEGFVKYRDTLVELVLHGKESTQIAKKPYPDYWDAAADKRLNPEQQQAYRKHLGELGWTKKYSPTNGETWKKPPTTPTPPLEGGEKSREQGAMDDFYGDGGIVGD